MAPYELAPGPLALILERSRKVYEAAIRLEHMTRRGAVPLTPANGELVGQFIRELEGAARLMPTITRPIGSREAPNIDPLADAFTLDPADIEVLVRDKVRINGREIPVPGTVNGSDKPRAHLSVVGRGDGPNSPEAA